MAVARRRKGWPGLEGIEVVAPSYRGGAKERVGKESRVILTHGGREGAGGGRGERGKGRKKEERKR
jgi:hypothetical protein